MLQIPCPWCGPREEIEFRHGGEGVALPAQASDAEWARVIYYRANPAGAQRERWVHVHGCRQWFYIVRDTLTHEITEARRLDEAAPPAASADGSSAASRDASLVVLPDASPAAPPDASPAARPPAPGDA